MPASVFVAVGIVAVASLVFDSLKITDPVMKEDAEYPDWLWKLLEPKVLFYGRRTAFLHRLHLLSSSYAPAYKLVVVF